MRMPVRAAGDSIGQEYLLGESVMCETGNMDTVSAESEESSEFLLSV